MICVFWHLSSAAVSCSLVESGLAETTGSLCCCLAWSFCWFLLFWRVFP